MKPRHFFFFKIFSYKFVTHDVLGSFTIFVLKKVPQCIQWHEPILSPIFLSQIKQVFIKPNSTFVDSYTCTRHYDLFCIKLIQKQYKRSTTTFKYDRGHVFATSPFKELR